MKLFFLCACLFALSITGSLAQESDPTDELTPLQTEENFDRQAETTSKKKKKVETTAKEDTTVYTDVEKMPEFPGGEEAFKKYLKHEIKYPQFAHEMMITGTVYVSFIVSNDGSIKDAKIVKGVENGKELDREALRVITTMPPWNPGKKGGKAVNVRKIVPIAFALH